MRLVRGKYDTDSTNQEPAAPVHHYNRNSPPVVLAPDRSFTVFTGPHGRAPPRSSQRTRSRGWTPISYDDTLALGAPGVMDPAPMTMLAQEVNVGDTRFDVMLPSELGVDDATPWFKPGTESCRSRRSRRGVRHGQRAGLLAAVSAVAALPPGRRPRRARLGGLASHACRSDRRWSEQGRRPGHAQGHGASSGRRSHSDHGSGVAFAASPRRRARARSYWPAPMPSPTRWQGHRWRHGRTPRCCSPRLTPSMPARFPRSNRVLTSGKTVFVLGGSAALSPHIEAALTAAHYVVVRLGGEDRFRGPR